MSGFKKRTPADPSVAEAALEERQEVNHNVAAVVHSGGNAAVLLPFGQLNTSSGGGGNTQNHSSATGK